MNQLFPNKQSDPLGAIPVWIARGAFATLIPLGYEQITDLTTVQNLTVPEGATIAQITVGGNGVRYRDDGTEPTPTVGMPLIQTQSLQYLGDLEAIQFIEENTGAVLDVSYYR